MSFVGDLLGSVTGQQDAVDPNLVTVDKNGNRAAASIKTSNQALQRQGNFARAVQAQNGLGHQNEVYNQLNNIANGTGPNPAQAALNQNTSANIANQAALMASQRGSAANAGMIARQAAQQGGALQQQAVGQEATLQANQSLSAINQMGGIAGQQAAQQAQATGAYTSAAQNQENMLLSNLNAQNQARVAQAGQTNQMNAANSATTGALVGNLAGAAGAAAMLAQGGVVAATKSIPDVTDGPTSHFGQYAQAQSGSISTSNNPNAAKNTFNDVMSMSNAIGSSAQTPSAIGSAGPGFKPAMPSASLAKGGKVPALVSPGERYLSPTEAKEVAKGDKSAMTTGEKIPGKPKVGGAKNDYANDTVPKMLETGGIVIPRSVTQAKDAEKKAIAFVQAVFAKKGQLPKGK